MLFVKGLFRAEGSSMVWKDLGGPADFSVWGFVVRNIP